MSYLFEVKVTELSPVWERFGLLSVILLFVKICLYILPFNVLDKLWALIRPVPGVS